MGKNYNEKRINPPIWQHDYHVLKRLYHGLDQLTQKYGKADSIILDYGCGTSPYQWFFKKVAKQYIRVDIKASKDVDLVVVEDEKINLKQDSIDLILSTQVLEHIRNPDFYLSECQRMLKSGGLLFLSTHGLWPYHPYPADFHRWTKKGLEAQIIGHNFKIEKSLSILGPFAAVIQFEMLLLADRLIKLSAIGKILLALLSLCGNALIWLEDKIAPPKEQSDSSLYLICARKI